jgi:hypothetical protein
MRILFSIFIGAFFSCSGSSNKKQANTSVEDSLKPHQQYCLDVLKKTSSKEISYQASDSFYLWAGSYVHNSAKPYYITRTVHEGFYTYLFWKKRDDSFVLYKESAEPKVALERDTLFDVDNDGYKDLLILVNSMNGQCQSRFPLLLCFDIDKGEFVEIEKVSNLPNPVFHPNDRMITGEWECQMTKDMYKLKWTGKFHLDTIYYKTIKL